jgi:hypothetical protein
VLRRRQCKLIVCIDGEANPAMQFVSLVCVVRYAAIDLGVRVELKLEDLQLQPNGRSPTHFSLFRVTYPGDRRGLLLYIKSSLTGNELAYILDYQAQHPTFPHESTANRFFDEAQFEAYRALGEHIGGELFRPELLGGLDPAKLTLRGWSRGVGGQPVRPGVVFLGDRSLAPRIAARGKGSHTHVAVPQPRLGG